MHFEYQALYVLCSISSSELPVLVPILQLKKPRLEAGQTAPGGKAGIPRTVSSALKCFRRSPKWCLRACEKQANVPEMQLLGMTAHSRGLHFWQLLFFHFH